MSKKKLHMRHNRPLSRRLDHCDHMIQNESSDPNGDSVHLFSAVMSFVFSGDVYVAMQIAFPMHKRPSVRFVLYV